MAKICGTNGDDVLIGTSQGDLIYGKDGDDVIIGLNGNNIVYGGNGDDCIITGDGNDKMTGDNGNDFLAGGLGKDYILGANGDDVIYGDNGFRADDEQVGFSEDIKDLVTGNYDCTVGGNDSIGGGTGSDELHGDGGNDLLDGGSGVDLLDGGYGNDSLYGGSDNDLLIGAQGNDLLKGGSGCDTYAGYYSEEICFGKDTICDDSGNNDVLDLSSFNTDEIEPSGPIDFIAVSTDGDQYVDSLWITFNQQNYILIKNYFNDHATTAAQSAPGAGLIENIEFSNETLHFSDVQQIAHP